METWVSAGDGGYLLREKGGRVAELHPSTDVGNVFFAGLGSIDGGDRMWIAPEVEIFYDGAPSEEKWRCPAELDPGTWRLEVAGEDAELTQIALGAHLRRHVTPLEVWEPAGALRWSGYSVDNTIETSNRWSAWHLVMLPAPADIFVRGGRDPVVYYPPAPAVTEGWMRADGHAPRWKIGFAPPRDGDVVVAALLDPDPGPLIVVTSRLDPGDSYVDVPPDGGVARAVQVFDSAGDGFCELELHAPIESRRIGSVVVAAWGSPRSGNGSSMNWRPVRPSAARASRERELRWGRVPA